MRASKRLFFTVSVASVTALTIALGCGTTGRSVFQDPQPEVADADNGPGFGDPPGDGRACVNLQCKQLQCGGTLTTTVTGKVYDPAGKNPLYNAIVYVPNAPLAPIAEGLSCDRCGELTTGSPIAVALTDAQGNFVLKNVPAGTDIPLVIQVGRWRRQVTLASVAPCVANPITDPDLTRLPRNHDEGDIPKIALASGSADPFECLLRKIGISDSEFTQGYSAGRVNYFVSTGRDMNPPAPSGPTLWGDPNLLRRYDMVILACEAGARTKGPQNTQNILDYTAAGGRVFTTHYGYVWIFGAQAPWPSVGAWHPEQERSDTVPLIATVDTTFPKGRAYADWLAAVDANGDAGYGRVAIREWRRDLDNVDPTRARQWMTANTVFGPDAVPNTVQHMTFNTPIDAPVDQAGVPKQCGRVVYSDFHVSASGNVVEGQPFFPQSCNGSPMTDQEKALEFMFFDLASCVQKDDDPPVPPVVK